MIERERQKIYGGLSGEREQNDSDNRRGKP